MHHTLSPAYILRFLLPATFILKPQLDLTPATKVAEEAPKPQPEGQNLSKLQSGAESYANGVTAASSALASGIDTGVAAEGVAMVAGGGLQGQGTSRSTHHRVWGPFHPTLKATMWGKAR